MAEQLRAAIQLFQLRHLHGRLSDIDVEECQEHKVSQNKIAEQSVKKRSYWKD
jgi:hypothetical protein